VYQRLHRKSGLSLCPWEERGWMTSKKNSSPDFIRAIMGQFSLYPSPETAGQEQSHATTNKK